MSEYPAGVTVYHAHLAPLTSWSALLYINDGAFFIEPAHSPEPLTGIENFGFENSSLPRRRWEASSNKYNQKGTP